MKIITLLCLIISNILFAQDSIAVTKIMEELQIPANKETYLLNEKRAVFLNGNEVFKQLIVKNFRQKVIQKIKENASCEITFIVETDGSMSNIKASGNNDLFNKETERAISKIKQKWIPGINNGQIVRSKFRLPLKVSFD
ncbi:hypothetical protein ATE47_16690 [Chryseobacterium sp. IHB B 17019]|jgi:protein TonB|uniref:energy transducer TonB n=1 Tax=Chryseobacterium sp. IHB B 17019 TaxID=1721091 RepID=UPI000722C019|nr:energy transducer TonB [Chryseobacterium sp. IHB B 17019]ALR32054.1 hypothetical protein ATE47_16690 [Chryseobacterium sp. IHB B 17019]